MEVDLDFKDITKDLGANFTKKGWTTVYESSGDFSAISHSTVFGCLTQRTNFKTAMSGSEWLAHLGDGCPTVVESYDGKRKVTKYYRQYDKKFDVLVHYRSNFGPLEGYLEISEEFRLYYNLFEKLEKENRIYIRFDSSGDEQEIARIEGRNRVLIRTAVLKNYISTKSAGLVLNFEFTRYSSMKLSELGRKEHHDQIAGLDFVYTHGIRDDLGISKDKTTQAWITGKLLISPIAGFKLDLFGDLDEDRGKFEDFLIGSDQNGKQIFFSCNEDVLSNYFGKNKGKPHYLTPVFFSRDVLKKYYDNPGKFAVSDGQVSCNGIWTLRLDNSHFDHVMVFLGDLGKLSYREQKYWKSFNIEVTGGMSETGFKRAILGEFADPGTPDLYLKMILEETNGAWKQTFGWFLFRPLVDADKHYLISLHRLTVEDNQKEFDEQVLALTKILIDSLNETELASNIDVEKDDRGIDKFEKFLGSLRIRNPDMVNYFRNLQTLRSKTVAHRRSGSPKDLKKVFEEFKIGEGTLSDSLDDILTKAIWSMNTLKRIADNWKV